MAKILIMDDYPSIRELLAQEFVAAGNAVTMLGKPESLLEEVTAFLPDLVIMDLFVKGEWQWEWLAKIKAQNPGLPVLIYSGYYPEGTHSLSLAEAFVMKSSDLDELKEAICRILDQNVLVMNL